MIMILGKNGAGKSYIANNLYKLGYSRVPSYTTRQMRSGEVNGIDYYFVTKQEFEKLIAESCFVEFKKRKDDYYGISLQNVSKSSILVAGNLSKIQQFDKEIIPIYLDCSLEERFRRVSERNIEQSELFDRFHLENFSFIDDFNAMFIDNSCFNNNTLNEIIALLSKNEFVFINNREFITLQVKEFSFDSGKDMLSFLKFEEYIVRKYSLLLNLEIGDDCNLFEKYYYKNIEDYLLQYGYDYYKKDDNLILVLNGNEFVVDFKKEKVRKLRR